jgi:competence protein ComEC
MVLMLHAQASHAPNSWPLDQLGLVSPLGQRASSQRGAPAPSACTQLSGLGGWALGAVLISVLIGMAGALHVPHLWWVSPAAPADSLDAWVGIVGLAWLLALRGVGQLLVRGRVPGVCRSLSMGVGLWGLLCLATAALAAWGTQQRAAHRLAQHLQPLHKGPAWLLEGRVEGLVQSDARSYRWVFVVERSQAWAAQASAPPGPARQAPRVDEGLQGRRLSMAWWEPDSRSAQAEPNGAPGHSRAFRPRAAERWRLVATLKRPHGLLNPGGFDLERWMFTQGLNGSATVQASQLAPQRLQAAPWYALDRWREAVREALHRRVDNPRTAAVLAALTVGDQSAISAADWAAFRDTGVAHLVSVSGLHVTQFAWLTQCLVVWLWRRCPRAVTLCAASVAGCWLGVAAAAAYAAFAGWGVPSQRTVWMLVVAAVLRHRATSWPAPLVLLAAASVVVWPAPWALLEAGFWLSFVAVAVLVLMGSGEGAGPDAFGSAGAKARSARPALAARPPDPQPLGAGWALLGRLLGTWSTARAALRALLHTQLWATLGLAPLSLVFFGQFSGVGLVANALSIPWVSLVLTPLALLGMLWSPLWGMASWAAGVWLGWLEGFAAWPLAVWHGAEAGVWAQVLGLLAGLAMVMPGPWAWRWLWLPCLWPLVFVWPSRPESGQFEVWAADVGQGSAVWLRTRHHSLLFDTGPRWGEDSDAGERVLLPLLRALGAPPLDLLVLSHRDTDHVGGAATLLRHWPVRAVSGSLEPGHALWSQGRSAGAEVRPCEAGQRWKWDGVSFHMLGPPAVFRTLALPSNAQSCVLRVQSASGRSLLLTGDIERLAESALVQHQASALPSEVLLAPHHGSRTSSSAAFLATVSAHTVWVQAGYRNRFGHPAPEVQARYQRMGLQMLDTPACGAIHWRAVGGVQAGGADMTCWRHTHRRFWHQATGRGAHEGVQPLDGPFDP